MVSDTEARRDDGVPLPDLDANRGIRWVRGYNGIQALKGGHTGGRRAVGVSGATKGLFDCQRFRVERW